METSIKIGDTVAIRGDVQKVYVGNGKYVAKYSDSQLVEGKYLKHTGTGEKWTGKVERINPDGDMAFIGGAWFGLKVLEVVGQEKVQEAPQEHEQNDIHYSDKILNALNARFWRVDQGAATAIKTFGDQPRQFKADFSHEERRRFLRVMENGKTLFDVDCRLRDPEVVAATVDKFCKNVALVKRIQDELKWAERHYSPNPKNWEQTFPVIKRRAIRDSLHAQLDITEEDIHNLWSGNGRDCEAQYMKMAVLSDQESVDLGKYDFTDFGAVIWLQDHPLIAKVAQQNPIYRTEMHWRQPEASKPIEALIEKLDRGETLNFRKVFELGKTSYMSDRRDNRVTVEVSYEDGKLSFMGNIYNRSNTDITAGGQIREEIAKRFARNPYMQELSAFWKTYHLNDAHPGTEAQEEMLERYKKEKRTTSPDGAALPDRNANHYEWAKKVLEGENMLIDGGHTYGKAWLKRDVPKEVLERIQSFPADLEMTHKGAHIGRITDIEVVGKRYLVTQKTGREEGDTKKHSLGITLGEMTSPKIGDLAEIKYNRDGIISVTLMQEKQVAVGMVR